MGIGGLMESKNVYLESLTQIFEIGMRINLETDMCCFIDVSGHVDHFEIKIAKSKENHFLDKFSSHKLYYKRSYLSEEENLKEFLEDYEEAIKDLNLILSKTFSKKFTAWCNLIDMSCHQVFTSEYSAKKWTKQMKSKYGKVDAIIGYKEELV